MILAAHQPNFIPYMGYFYKIYLSDIFALSDNVEFSRREFHNFNYIWENKEKAKITLPVDRHSGIISEVKIANKEESFSKIIRRIELVYHRQKYFDEVFPLLKKCFLMPHENMISLNTEIIKEICKYLGIKTNIVYESEICKTYGNASQQIVQLCKNAKCSVYLSGTGAKKYLDEQLMKDNGIELIWSNYKEIEYNSLPNLSVVDYIMKCGNHIPEQWKEEKEELNGK